MAKLNFGSKNFVHHPAPSLLCTRSGIVHTVNDVGLSLLGSVSMNTTLQSMLGDAAASLQAVFTSLKAMLLQLNRLCFSIKSIRQRFDCLETMFGFSFVLQEEQVDHEVDCVV